MSTDLIEEEDNKGYTLTRFAGGTGAMYQITQQYKETNTDESTKFMRNLFGYVCVSEKDLEYMLKIIKKKKG